MEWIDSVLREVAELPDRNSPEGWPEAMLVTGAELRQIIITHAPAEPVNARLLDALKRAKDSLVAFKFVPEHANCWEASDEENLTAVNSAISAAEAQQAGPVPLQSRVKPWMLACFGETIASDRCERNHRFLEEALELVQALGCTPSEAHQLVDYVFGRPVGEPHQEVGGVMITLAALCLANTLDMHAAGEDELARIWTKVEQIRAKQAAKPKNSPLPETQKSRPALLTDEDFFQEIEGAGIPVQDVAMACAIKDLVQTAVLRANGLKPQAKD